MEARWADILNYCFDGNDFTCCLFWNPGIVQTIFAVLERSTCFTNKHKFYTLKTKKWIPLSGDLIFK